MTTKVRMRMESLGYLQRAWNGRPPKQGSFIVNEFVDKVRNVLMSSSLLAIHLCVEVSWLTIDWWQKSE